MYRDITTEELSQAIQWMIHFRNEQVNPTVFNLDFPTTLEECDGPNRTAVFRYHTYPWMSNLNQVVHGGMTAALLDVSMATLNISLYGVVTPTLNMTVNYTRAVPLNQDILVRVQAAATGSSTAHMTAWLYLPGEINRPLATANGLYYTAQAVRDNHTDLL